MPKYFATAAAVVLLSLFSGCVDQAARPKTSHDANGDPIQNPFCGTWLTSLRLRGIIQPPQTKPEERITPGSL